MILFHTMVLTEEEHLTRVHGDAYRDYCRRVPRYLGKPTLGSREAAMTITDEPLALGLRVRTAATATLGQAPSVRSAPRPALQR